MTRESRLFQAGGLYSRGFRHQSARIYYPQCKRERHKRGGTDRARSRVRPSAKIRGGRSSSIIGNVKKRRGDKWGSKVSSVRKKIDWLNFIVRMGLRRGQSIRRANCLRK